MSSLQAESRQASHRKTLHLKYQMDTTQLALLHRLAAVVGQPTIRGFLGFAISEYCALLQDSLARAAAEGPHGMGQEASKLTTAAEQVPQSAPVPP